MKVKGTLRVDGLVEGRLDADCVVLSENAAVKGEIQARKIIVGGKVEGNLRAQELVRSIQGKDLGRHFYPEAGGDGRGGIQRKG